jgi:hypothetical protein
MKLRVRTSDMPLERAAARVTERSRGFLFTSANV